MQPSVSVIIPTYNHRDYVVEALESVFAQTYIDYEVIVVNDGSPDDTAAVLRPYVESGRIKYIEQNNQGQAAARNRGLAEAKGEFIAFLDDDDLWTADKLSKQVAVLMLDNTLVCVGGSATTKFNGQVLPDNRLLPKGILMREDLYDGNPFNSPGQVLIRRSALDRIGGFDESLKGTDDFELWFRLVAVGKILIQPAPVLIYRLHELNASRDKALMLRNTMLALDIHLAKEPLAMQRVLRKRAGRFLFHYGVGGLISQTRGDLRRFRFKKAFAQFSVMQHMLIPMLRDPIQLWWFAKSWVPKWNRQ